MFIIYTCYIVNISCLFVFVPDAVKHNPPTSSVTRKRVEENLKTWFGKLAIAGKIVANEGAKPQNRVVTLCIAREQLNLIRSAVVLINKQIRTPELHVRKHIE